MLFVDLGANNTVTFAPSGRVAMLGGFGNLQGNMQFWEPSKHSHSHVIVTQTSHRMGRKIESDWRSKCALCCCAGVGAVVTIFADRRAFAAHSCR